MTSTTPVEEIVKALEIDEVSEDAAKRPPSYNVAPTQEVLVVNGRNDSRYLQTMRWGLVPFFAKDVSSSARMINARAEGLATKPAYRRPLERRRCLILFDGFYEWQGLDNKNKQPWYFTSAAEPLAFAGLWDVWQNPNSPEDADTLLSCTIITTTASPDMREIHHRMPLILTADSWQPWLDVTGTNAGYVESMLKTPQPGLLGAYKVLKLVNNVRNDGAHLIDEVESEA